MTTDSPTTLSVCLVRADALVESTVRLICAAPHRITVFDSRDLVTEAAAPSENARAIALESSASDVVLVEWNLDQAPEINVLCYHVRRHLAAPVIMLCPHGAADFVPSLAAGADDAVSFPFSIAQIQAKVLAYRRLVAAARSDTHSTPGRKILEHGPLRLDVTAHRFFVNDRDVELTPREFALLRYLVERQGVLCSRDDIQDQVWGIQFDTGTNMVDVYMYFLRRKLAAHGVTDIIKTIRGHGYRLE